MLNRGALLLSQGYKCWPQDLPVLMLHGTKDMVNSCPSTEKFFEVLQAPDKQLIIYPDMWHDLMTEPAVKEQYFEDCASWLEEDAGASLRRSSLYRCSFNRDQGAFMLKKGLKASIRDHGTPTSSTYWAQTLSPVTERVRAWKEALVAPKCTLCNTRESPPLALRPTDVDGHHQNCTDGPWRARVG
ncbi:hypothetical protein OF83DRAFT_494075 [Amylostereum chailletii]|nr:hypothetical protein OF83DRAFT_494075 [Amylostereum chailletii]